jgi:hypothetical protein
MIEQSTYSHWGLSLIITSRNQTCSNGMRYGTDIVEKDDGNQDNSDSGFSGGTGGGAHRFSGSLWYLRR